MTSTNTRTAHALALTAGGLDGLADAAGLVDLRQVVAYAEALLEEGVALAVAPGGGWFVELAMALGRAPSALEVEGRKPGAWWVVLGWAYERDGQEGLLAWGVPADLVRAVEAELLEDLVGAWDDAMVRA